MKTSRCRSCGAPIIWAKTIQGKTMPLDVKSEKRFLAIEVDGQTTCIQHDTYVSHFATCPDADQHRRAR